MDDELKKISEKNEIIFYNGKIIGNWNSNDNKKRVGKKQCKARFGYGNLFKI